MSLVDNFLAIYGTNVFLGQSGEHGNGGSQELDGVQDMMKYHQVQTARKPTKFGTKIAHSLYNPEKK